jgi:hypothetical protein
MYTLLMNLAQQIKQYYFENIQELPAGKSFHFASRLAAWEGSPQAAQRLRELKDYMLQPKSEDVLLEVLNMPPGKLYAADARKVYFDKYPRLFGIHNAFFRIRHLKEIYGLDLRDDFLKLVSKSELEDLYAKLSTDMDAVRILSRFAVDYIYLYEILYELNSRLDPRVLLAQKKNYNLDDPVELHLFIYLFTHSIIADSNFYIKNVPVDRLPLYKTMLQELEDVMKGRTDIKLDNKFEFLVASRICDRETSLFVEINRQTNASLDDSGQFIIDRLNSGVNKALNTFSGSEHRNVLFIMSGSRFVPHSPLLTAQDGR